MKTSPTVTQINNPLSPLLSRYPPPTPPPRLLHHPRRYDGTERETLQSQIRQALEKKLVLEDTDGFKLMVGELEVDLNATIPSGLVLTAHVVKGGRPGGAPLHSGGAAGASGYSSLQPYPMNAAGVVGQVLAGTTGFQLGAAGAAGGSADSDASRHPSRWRPDEDERLRRAVDSIGPKVRI